MDEANASRLLVFLKSLESGERPATHLFLLGDIFDLWVGPHDFFRQRFAPLVDVIHRLSRRIQVEYFEGNHDVHVRKFWEGTLGIPCWVSERYVELGGRLVRLEHGDLINPEDKAYLRWRSVLRQPAMEVLAQVLPGPVIQGIGDWLSQASRRRSHVTRRDRENELRQMIRTYAEESFRRIPFDAIITGHMHILDEHEFTVNERTVVSYNLGSWFERPGALQLLGDEFKWVSLT